MALQTFSNGESGSSVRTKINANFTELYAGMSAAQLAAIVNTIPIFEGTWAALLAGYPAASHSGKRAVVTDPTYFVNPIRVRSDGTKWRLDGMQDVWFNTTPMTGGVGTVTTEQLQHQWTAPAGFLTSLRGFSIKRLDYKTATSDTYTIRVRVGAGSTPLTDTLTQNSAQLTGTNRSVATEFALVPTSATQLRLMGTSTLIAWSGLQTAFAYPTNYTIPDSDAANTVFSCTMLMTTGTDSSTSGQAHLIVTGY